MAAQQVLSTLLLAFLMTSPMNSLQWGKPRADVGVPSTARAESADNTASHTQKGGRASQDAGAAAAAVIRAGGLEGNARRNQVAYPEETTWIHEFCRTPGNEFFAEVSSTTTSAIKMTCEAIDSAVAELLLSCHTAPPGRAPFI